MVYFGGLRGANEEQGREIKNAVSRVGTRDKSSRNLDHGFWGNDKQCIDSSVVKAATYKLEFQEEQHGWCASWLCLDYCAIACPW